MCKGVKFRPAVLNVIAWILSIAGSICSGPWTFAVRGVVVDVKGANEEVELVFLEQRLELLWYIPLNSTPEVDRILTCNVVCNQNLSSYRGEASAHKIVHVGLPETPVSKPYVYVEETNRSPFWRFTIAIQLSCREHIMPPMPLVRIPLPDLMTAPSSALNSTQVEICTRH